MKVIFVHGRDQQDQSAEQLRDNWITQWKIGLDKSGLAYPKDNEIIVPYYAQTLFDLIDDATYKKIIVEARRSDKVGINEAKQFEFYQDFLTEIATKSATTFDERMDLKKINTTKRDLLNWAPIQDLIEFLDRKNIFGDYPIRLATKDVFIYLTQNHIKEQINHIIEKEFDDQPCVVVGHSLGSIITYLVLKNNPKFNVKKFITIGSPLGVQAIKKFLELPLEMPKSIKSNDTDRWYNAYDDLDYVALNPLNRQYFDNGFDIVNSNHVNNETKNHHGINGYLSDRIIAKVIWEAMQ